MWFCNSSAASMLSIILKQHCENVEVSDSAFAVYRSHNHKCKQVCECVCVCVCVCVYQYCIQRYTFQLRASYRLRTPAWSGTLNVVRYSTSLTSRILVQRVCMYIYGVTYMIQFGLCATGCNIYSGGLYFIGLMRYGRCRCSGPGVHRIARVAH